MKSGSLPLLILAVGGVVALSSVRAEEKAVSLFDGDTPGHWQSIEFGGEGEVHVSFEGALTLENGNPMTGVVWTGDALPKSNYEISLEAKKHYGDDFFCGLTFPVGDSHATFVCGGWGGAIVGLSSINGDDASLNETRKLTSFENERWYSLRLRVTDTEISGWIDNELVFEVQREGKEFDLRPGPIEACVPLGIANYRTRSAFRKIELKPLD